MPQATDCTAGTTILHDCDMLVRVATSIGAALLVVDRDLNIVWTNEVLERWFTETESLAAGKCYEVFHGNSRPCQQCALRESFETGAVATTEKIHVFPDGRERQLLITITPIVQGDGTVAQVLEMVQDITERKRAEDEVAQRLLYERMVEEISSGFIVSSDFDEELDSALEKLGAALRTDFAWILNFDLGHKQVTLTHEWTVLGAGGTRGVTLPMMLTDPWPKVLIGSDIVKCPDTSCAARPEYHSLKAAGLGAVLAVRFATGSDARGFLCVGHYGDARNWMEEDIWVVGTVARFIGLGFERKRREQEFVESQRRYKEILNTLREGVGVVDTNERICFCNPSFESIFEVPMSDLIGKSILDFLDETGRNRVLDETSRRKNGASSSYELPIKTASGKEKHLLVNVSPLSDAVRGYAGAVGVVLDITERKQAEEELRQFAEELEQSNELKDLFADILRHDLLDSIGVVKAYAETLLENEAAPREEFLNIIVQNIDKVVGIVQDASQLARLEASSELEMEPVNLYEMAKEVVDTIGASASENGTVLMLTGEQDILVTANPVIREVFRNLISNAVKYGARKDRIVVSISKSADEIRISVADSGGGIPDEQKESIFERFKRASRNAVKGTGLGLAIAKRIVQLHGGKIWVEDNPEGGAIFVVTLPASLSVGARIAA